MKKGVLTYFNSLVAILNLILLIGLIFFVIPQQKHGWSDENLREYALKLKTNGMLNEAAEAFEEYIQVSSLDDMQTAHIYFLLAEAFFKQGEYQKALAYYYKTEVSDTSMKYEKDLSRQIVACLEYLGKSQDADLALKEKVRHSEETKVANREDIVAKVGERLITMGEIHDQIEQLPEAVQESIRSEEAKRAFLIQYVAKQLLLRKAFKLDLQSSEEIKQRVQKIKQNFMIQKVIEENVTSEIEFDEQDLKLFFEANRKKYLGENSENITFEEVRDDVYQTYLSEKFQYRLSQYIANLLKENDVEIYLEISNESLQDELQKVIDQAGDQSEI